MEDIINKIKQLAHAQREEVIEWRRWMHQHPDLSQEEYGTMEFVAERLRAMGLNPKTGIGKTTFVQLLLGLLPAEQGTLYVPEQGFAYVPQGNTLLSGTIRYNLLFGNPAATDSAMREALTAIEPVSSSVTRTRSVFVSPGRSAAAASTSASKMPTGCSST